MLDRHPDFPDLGVNIVLIAANGVNAVMFVFALLGGPIRYVRVAGFPGSIACLPQMSWDAH